MTNTKIEIKDIQEIKPLRENDESIMELAMKYTDLQTTLKQINTCRKWMRVRFMSKITTTEGNKLNSDAYLGTHKNKQPTIWEISENPTLWPEIPRPTNMEWNE